MTTSMIAGGALALAWSAYAASIFLDDPQGRDFGSFYASGAAWLKGEPLYVADVKYPNLNPPIVVAVLFAPLAVLPVRIAALIWLILGALALVSILAMVFAELRLPLESRVWAVVVLLASMGSALAWSQGQLTWILLVPLSASWQRFRRGSLLGAGVWLGPAIVAKPFLAVLPLILGPRVLLGAVPASLTLLLLGMVVTGSDAWFQWLALGGTVEWLAWPANASVWGVLSRASGGLPLSSTLVGIPKPAALLGVVLLVCAAVVSCRCAAEPDRRFLAGLCLTLLASPLGWVYYVPWVVGPYLAVLGSRPGGTDRLAMALLIVPMPLLGLVIDPPWLFATAGSLYAWALLLIWWRAVSGPRNGHRLRWAVSGS